MSRLAILPTVLTGLTLCATAPAACADEIVGPSVSAGKDSCESIPCGSGWIVPITRVVALDAVKYGGLVVIWPDSFKPSTASQRLFVDNWSDGPEYRLDRGLFGSDGAPAYFNAVFHGLAGSETYLAARVWGHGVAASFFFSVITSFTWEYLVEGWFQRPSLIDLFWTPVAGVVIGEFRHWLLGVAHERISSRAGRVAVMSILDPLGQIERALLGCEYGASQR